MKHSMVYRKISVQTMNVFFLKFKRLIMNLNCKTEIEIKTTIFKFVTTVQLAVPVDMISLFFLSMLTMFI